MTISLVAATDLDGVIGVRGGLPWHLPADLRRFKRITMGKPLIMGRKTHESIGRVLPGRKNIVLTRQAGYEASGCAVVRSAPAAIDAARPAEEAMIIGGAAVYEAFLPLAGRFYLTLVRAHFEGDARFPDWNPLDWTERERTDHEADERNPHPYSFILLTRNRKREASA